MAGPTGVWDRRISLASPPTTTPLHPCAIRGNPCRMQASHCPHCPHCVALHHIAPVLRLVCSSLAALDRFARSGFRGTAIGARQRGWVRGGTTKTAAAHLQASTRPWPPWPCLLQRRRRQTLLYLTRPGTYVAHARPVSAGRQVGTPAAQPRPASALAGTRGPVGVASQWASCEVGTRHQSVGGDARVSSMAWIAHTVLSLCVRAGAAARSPSRKGKKRSSSPAMAELRFTLLSPLPSPHPRTSCPAIPSVRSPPPPPFVCPVFSLSSVTRSLVAFPCLSLFASPRNKTSFRVFDVAPPPPPLSTVGIVNDLVLAPVPPL